MEAIVHDSGSSRSGREAAVLATGQQPASACDQLMRALAASCASCDARQEKRKGRLKARAQQPLMDELWVQSSAFSHTHTYW